MLYNKFLFGVIMIKKQDKNLTIKKDRYLIHISNNITLAQKKLHNALIYKAKKDLFQDNTQRIFTIDIVELNNLTGVNISNNIQLKTELKALTKINVEYIGFKSSSDLTETDWGYFNLLSEVNLKNSIVTFEFSSSVLKAIYNPTIFTVLELTTIKNFTSKFSLALYEFLKDRKTYIPVLTITDCKKMLVGDVSLFERFQNFKKDVLDIATNEITLKSDLIASYELVKNKNTYTHIKFKSIPKEPEGTYNKLENEIIQQLKEYFVKKDKSFDFDSRFEKVEFIKDNDKLVIKTLPELEYKKQWLIDNNFDKKIKNILFQQFNIIFKEVVLK